jgi:hypothetical protein
MARAPHVHKPLINFIGKRTFGVPQPLVRCRNKRLISVVGAVESHNSQPHSQPATEILPTPATDFKRYRANAQQHGPLARSGHFPSLQTNVNSAADSDVVLDRDDLPARFRRMVLTTEEIEAVDVRCSIGKHC